MPQALKPLCVIHFWVNPFFSYCPLSGVIRNWTPQYKDQVDENYLEQNELKWLQMVQLECPQALKPVGVVDKA